MADRKVNTVSVRKVGEVCPLLPVTVVARAAGVSRQRVYNLHDLGLVRFVNVGGFVLVDVFSLLKHYEEER